MTSHAIWDARTHAADSRGKEIKRLVGALVFGRRSPRQPPLLGDGPDLWPLGPDLATPTPDLTRPGDSPSGRASPMACSEVDDPRVFGAASLPVTFRDIRWGYANGSASWRASGNPGGVAPGRDWCAAGAREPASARMWLRAQPQARPEASPAGARPSAAEGPC
jgi:hypothetical protein